MIRQNDLFAEAEHQAGEALAQVCERGFAVFDLLCDGRITDDRACDQLREHGDIQQQMQRVALDVDLLPVQVNDVGEDLEGVKADADGQCQLRHGDAHPGDQVQVFRNKAAVFEHAEQADVENQAQNHDRLGAACFLPLLAAADAEAEQIVHQHADQQQNDIGRLAPGIEDQREQR